jgi:hypothetical protein
LSVAFRIHLGDAGMCPLALHRASATGVSPYIMGEMHELVPSGT